MNRLSNCVARMERLTRSGDDQIPARVHLLTIEAHEDADARIQAMIASGEGGPDDLFIFRRILEPVRDAA